MPDDLVPDHGEPVEDADRRPGSPAAYASNWRTVLVVDAAMGAVVAVVGVVLIAVWNLFVGVALTGLGLFYVAMVVRRGRTWRELRHAAGM